MKGLALAILLFLLLAVLSVPTLRIYKGNKFFKPLILLYLLSTTFYLLLFHDFSMEWCNGFVILTLLFFNFLDLVYGAFLSGFSSEMLAWMFQKEKTGVPLGELMHHYGSDQIPDPVLAKKLQTLSQGNYIMKKHDGSFQLRPKGKFVATVVQLFYKIFHVEEGG